MATHTHTRAVDSVELLIYGTAESASTIMAVSIPMLRALLHTPKTKSPRLNFEPESSRNFSYPSRQNSTRSDEKDDAIVEDKSESGSVVVL